MQKQPFETRLGRSYFRGLFQHFFREVKARAGALPLCAVVKADSYRPRRGTVRPGVRRGGRRMAWRSAA